MKASEWMTREACTCRPDTSLNDAAHLMWSHDCGILPVVGNDGRLAGVITDRDLCMGAFLGGKSLKELKVADSMTRKVYSCRTVDTIEDVIRCMSDHQVRRVPIVDARGNLQGIVSLNDLARHLVALEDEKLRVRLAPRFLEALASISETRQGGRVPERVPVEVG